ncbi:MAG: DNRLRE domain-containing protein [Bacteroidetes bacterium]|nr:DNRLRE domain-containing protein [Bacteroidota bacterium]MDA0874910.1 DNRLRE domain-containing protein [Bacteroidota bacterium]
MHRTSLLLVIALLTIPATAQSTVDIQASKDNTLYQDSAGELSNGAGESLFAGLTIRSEVRRALVAFDLSAIPAGVRVDSVQVSLTMTKSLGSLQSFLLHRVTQAWGEGASNAGGQEGSGTAAAAGDATWTQAIRPSTTWTAPGGDFVRTASASRTIQATGEAVWFSTPALVADVSGWLADPSRNFGWIVLGNENVSGSAMRFASRQHASTSQRPLLRVF